MTTVAWDGETLAADRKMGDRYNVQKIFPVPTGFAAGCGDYDSVIEIVQWLRDGEPRDSVPVLQEKDDDGDSCAEVVVVDRKGRIDWLTWPYLRRIRLHERFVAIGSGEEVAIGAMAFGATARQAVAVACRYDPNTGQGIDSVRVVKGSRNTTARCVSSRSGHANARR